MHRHQTPQAALILERQLIREHMPRFNSMLKDGKSFPYLAMTNEEYPRIMYAAAAKIRSTMGALPQRRRRQAGDAALLRRQFGIRDCKELLPQGCLSMHIGLCAGPCIDGTGYDERVKTVRRVLNGDAAPLLEELVAEMEAASETQAYEVAAQHRDMIRAVRATTSQHVVSSKVYRDCDAIGIAHEGDLAALVVLHADEGVVQGQEAWPAVHRGDLGETVSMFIAEHYAHRTPPRLLLSPVPVLTASNRGWTSDEARPSSSNAAARRFGKPGDLGSPKRARFSCNAWPTNPAARSSNGPLMRAPRPWA